MEKSTHAVVGTNEHDDEMGRYERTLAAYQPVDPATLGGLAKRVAELKHERDAVILAHYYVPAETQALADYVGDSFYLARLAPEPRAHGAQPRTARGLSHGAYGPQGRC